MPNVALVGLGKKEKSVTAAESKEGLLLRGHSELVDKYIKCDKAVTHLNGELARIRQILDAEAINERLQAEKKGIFAKSVSAKGRIGVIRYTFKNAYSGIPEVNAPVLKDKLTEGVFESLFTTKETVKIRPGMEKELYKALGDKADTFLIKEKCITPVPDYREKRFELRSTLPELINSNLDEVTIQISQKPALSCK